MVLNSWMTPNHYMQNGVFQQTSSGYTQKAAQVTAGVICFECPETSGVNTVSTPLQITNPKTKMTLVKTSIWRCINVSCQKSWFSIATLIFRGIMSIPCSSFGSVWHINQPLLQRIPRFKTWIKKLVARCSTTSRYWKLGKNTPVPKSRRMDGCWHTHT